MKIEEYFEIGPVAEGTIGLIKKLSLIFNIGPTGSPISEKFLKLYYLPIQKVNPRFIQLNNVKNV